MSENDDGCGLLIGFLIVAIIGFFVVVYIVAPIVVVIIASGSVWGAGHGCLNYCRAFTKNVGFE
jgi:hypothetical protein